MSAAAAEPRPAELPLPGGRDGASVRVRPLLTGRARSPKANLLREEGRLAKLHANGLLVPRSEYRVVPVPAFLVEHPGAGLILVDTGFHPSVAVDPAENLGRAFTLLFKDFEMEPEQAVAAQLRASGRSASDVKVVVMTHLHADHASAMSEFPDATFVFSRAEWAAATDGGQLDGYMRRQFDHAFDYRTLDFDGRGADSYSTFGRAFDLLGDGSIRLVFTPGHTLGHMSVVLRTTAREVLLAGDALFLERTLREHHLPARLADEHLFRRSLREIELYAREAPDALIVPGHDLDFWERLPAVLE
jgi:glyoxylase-like metal-dependent hydrolase (beta-lactamase superfamily II)